MADGIATEMTLDLQELAEQVKAVTEELIRAAGLETGEILVVGCSSSEIAHHRIGSFSNAEIGETVFHEIQACCSAHGIFLATQCCEHLNRALIVEKECAKEYRLTRVNVVPQLKAGGAFSTAAYRGFANPVAVETVCAQAGIDIGDTLIGMHLEPVAVPVRTKVQQIGSAHVVCARTRAKYVGGIRAHYDETLE